MQALFTPARAAAEQLAQSAVRHARHAAQELAATDAAHSVAVIMREAAANDAAQSAVVVMRNAARIATQQVRQATRDLAPPRRERIRVQDVPEPEWYGWDGRTGCNTPSTSTFDTAIPSKATSDQHSPPICGTSCDRSLWAEPYMPETVMFPTPGRPSEGLPPEYFSSAVTLPGNPNTSMLPEPDHRWEPTLMEPNMEVPMCLAPYCVSDLLPEHCAFASRCGQDTGRVLRRALFEPERPPPDPEPPPSAIGRVPATPRESPTTTRPPRHRMESQCIFAQQSVDPSLVIYQPDQQTGRWCFYDGRRGESTDHQLNARDFMRSFEVMRATQFGWDDARAIAECKVRCSYKLDSELATLEVLEPQGWRLWKAAFIDRFRHVTEDYDKFDKLLNACCKNDESIPTFNASFVQIIADVKEICLGKPMPDEILKHIYLRAIPPAVREQAASKLDKETKLHDAMLLCAQTEYYMHLPTESALPSASTYVIRSLPSYSSREERIIAARKRADRRAATARRKAGLRNVGIQTM